MIGSRRTVLNVFASLAATALVAPALAGDATAPLRLSQARSAAPDFVGIS